MTAVSEPPDATACADVALETTSLPRCGGRMSPPGTFWKIGMRHERDGHFYGFDAALYSIEQDGRF